MSKTLEILTKGIFALSIIAVLGVYLPSLIGFEIEFFAIILGGLIALGIVSNLIIWIYKLIKMIIRK